MIKEDFNVYTNREDITAKSSYEYTQGGYTYATKTKSGSDFIVSKFRSSFGANYRLSYGLPTKSNYKYNPSGSALADDVTLEGFAYSENATESSQTAGDDEFYPTGDMYAMWSFPVYYYNGTTLLGSSEHVFGTAKALTTWSKLGGSISSTYAGKGWDTFYGWMIRTTATRRSKADGANITITNTESARASYKNGYYMYALYSRTVTFKSGVSAGTTDGTQTQYCNPASNTVSSITSYTPTTTGLSTYDWSESGYRADAETKIGTYSSSSSIVPAYNASNTLYAVYSRILTVAFNGNNSTGGSTSSVTKTIYLNAASTTTGSQQVALTANGFVRDGYTFQGWATSPTGAKVYDNRASYTAGLAYNASSFTKTLYAVWQGNLSNATVTLNYTTATYTGSAKTPTVTVTLGQDTLTKTTHYTVGYSNNTNAGTATVTVTAVSGTIYTGSKSVTFTINEASMTVSASGYSGTYDGSAHSASITVSSPTGTTIKWGTSSGSYTNTLTSNSTTSTYSMGSRTDYGTTTIYYQVTKTNHTTRTGSVTISISKASISPTVSMSGYTYAGTKSTPSISGNTGGGTVTYYYNTSNSNSGGTAWTNVTSSTSLNAGTYYMYATVAATTNYSSATTATRSFTISKATNTLTVSAVTGLVYGSTSAMVSASSAQGSVYYAVGTSLTSSNYSSSGSTTKPTASGRNAGTYTVYYYCVGNTNYNAKSGNVSVTIIKAMVTTITTLSVSTTGVVTWSGATNATGYQISIDNTTWTSASSGVNYNSTIVKSTGSRTVYVRAINSDSTNYSTPSATMSKTVTVYTLTVSKGTGVSSVSGGGNYISGRSVSISASMSTGYSFSKWTASSTSLTIASSTSASTTVTVSATGTVTASAIGNIITITLNHGGGTASYSTLYYRYGINVFYSSYTNSTLSGQVTSVVPTRTGYTFGGYYATSGTQYISASGAFSSALCTAFTTNPTLTAQWTANKYKVTLNNQSATSAGTTTVWYYYNTTKTISSTTVYYYSDEACTTMLSGGYNITVPTKTGYTFGGYYTATGGSGTQYVNASGSFVNNLYKNNASNITLYAKWTYTTYTLTVNKNSATSYSGSTSYTGNMTSTASVPVASKTGYNFAGWLPIDAIGSVSNTFGTMLKSSADFSTKSNLSVYNNAGGGTVTLTRATDSTNPLGSGYSVKIVTNGTASPGAGGFYDTFTPSAGYTYYQVILAKIPVGYRMVSARNAAGDSATDMFYDFYTKTWVSAGQNTATAGTGDWKVYVYRLVPGSTGSYSSCGHKYVISTGGGSNTSVTWYVGYSQVFKIASSTTSQGVGNVATTYSFGVGNNKLVAGWEAVVARVTLNNQSATSSTDTTSFFTRYNNAHYTSSSFTTTLTSITVPTRTGYTFGGYYTATNGGGTKIIDASGAIANTTFIGNSTTITLYAKWTANTYTVSYNANGGSCTSTSKTVTYGEKYGDLPTPTRTGYTFKGWYTASSGGSQVTASTLVATASNHTIFAQWTANTYTIGLNTAFTQVESIVGSPTINGSYVSGLSNANYLQQTAVTGGKAWFSNTSWEIGVKVDNSATTTQYLFNTKGAGPKFGLMMGVNDTKFFIYSSTSGSSWTTSYTTICNLATADGAFTWVKFVASSGTITVSYSYDGISYTTATTISGNPHTSTSDKFTIGYAWGDNYSGKTVVDMSDTYVKVAGSLVWGQQTGGKKATYDSTYGTLPTPTRTGYTFNGWKQDIITKENRTVTNSTTYGFWSSALDEDLISNTTYYVKARVKVASAQTIALYLDGGYVNVKSVKGTGDWVYLEGTFTTGDVSTYTHGGKKVATLYNMPSSGCSTNSVCLDGITIARLNSTSVTSSTKVSKAYNHTLTASWTANTYTVAFNGNGNTGGSTASITATYDQTYTLTANGFTKTGYTFAGWATSASGSVAYANKASVKNLATSGTYTLYAVWTLNKSTIKLGTMSNVTAVYYGTSSTSQTTQLTTAGFTANANQNYYFKATVATATGYTITFGTWSGWFTDTANPSGGHSFTASGQTYTVNASATKTLNTSTIKLGTMSNVTAVYYGTSSTSQTTQLTTTGFTANANQSYYFKATVATATGYTITFSTWSGWFTDSANPSGAHSFTASGQTYTVNASATKTANQYTLTANANGGTIPSTTGWTVASDSKTATKSVTYNSTYGTLPTPTRTGYTLKGWYTASSGGTQVTSTTTVTTASAHTIYAQWTLNTSTIKLGTMSNVTAVYYGTSSSSQTTQLTTTGFTANANQSYYFKATVATATGYTITFSTWSGWFADTANPSGGHSFTASGQTYTVNASATKTLNTSTIKLGTMSNVTAVYYGTSSTSQTTQLTTTGFTANANQSYYFKATVATATGYTITFSTWSGWFTDTANPSGGHSFTAKGQTYTVNASATKTGNNYTVSYSPNGGSITSNFTSKTVTYGSAYGAPPDVTRSGYALNGWYTASSGGTKITDTTTVTTAGAHTLYAQWTAGQVNYTINVYIQNASTGSYELKENQTKQATADSSLTLEAIAGLTGKAVANGIIYDATTTQANNGNATSVTISGAGTTTVKVYFSRASYTLTIKANGGTADGTATLRYGQAYSVSARTRTGYTLTGYTITNTSSSSTSDIGGATISFDSSTKVGTFTQGTKAVTLTAKWSTNGYTVTYNGNEGTASSTSKSVTYDSTYGTLATATRTGYTFKGWKQSLLSYASDKVISHSSSSTWTGGWNTGIVLKNLGITLTDGETYKFAFDIRLNTTSGTQAWNNNTLFINNNTRGTIYRVSDNVLATSTTITTSWQRFYGTFTYTTDTGASYSNDPIHIYPNFTDTTLPTQIQNIELVSVADSGYTTSSTKVTTAYNHTLYAQWTANVYTITLNNQSATSAGTTAIYEKYATGWYSNGGATTSITTITNPSRTGYTFGGYYTATGGSGTQIIDVSGKITATNSTFTANTTIYAKWTINSYNLTVNGNNGTFHTNLVYNLANEGSSSSMVSSGSINYYVSNGTVHAESAKDTGSDQYGTTNVKANLTAGHSYTFRFKVKSTVESITPTVDLGWFLDKGYTYYIFKTGFSTKYNTGTEHTTTIDCTTTGTFYLRVDPNVVGSKIDFYDLEMYDNSVSAISSATYTNNYNTLVTLPIPTRTGYTFNGWSKSGTGTLTNNSFRYGAGAGTVTAQWTANTYTIVFNANGGSGSMSNLSMTYDTAKNLTANAFTKTGYTFAGWATSATGSVAYADKASVKNLATSGTYTLYAKWTANTYTIVFNANGGSGTMSNLSMTYDTAKNLTANAFTKTGYTFAGWATSATGGVAYADKASVKNLTTSGTYTLYAKWTANTYTIVFNANGGSGTMSNLSMTYDTAKNLTANAFTKTGYTFAGWATSATGSVAYADKASVKNLATSGTYNLYANWTANKYKVTLDNQSATSTNDTTAVWYYYNTTKTINSTTVYYYSDEACTTMLTSGYIITTPTKTGYTFGGYYTSTGGSGTQYVNASGSFVNNLYKNNASNITLYAKWTANTYTITFNGNGGTVSSASKTVTYDSTYGSLATATRTGYTINSWNTKSDGTGSTITSNTKVTITANQTLYAKWDVETYTISYTLNGGSVSTANPTSYTVETATFTLNNPTKAGYTFAGWTGSNGTTASTSVSIAKGSTGNKSYTANWTANTYTITINENGGSAVNDMSYTVSTSSQTKTLNQPTKSGYSLSWSITTNSSGATSSVSGNTLTIPAGAYGGITVKAVWTANTYTVTYNANGGSCASTSKTVTYASTYGDLPTATRSGYTFAGWFTSASGGTQVTSTTTVSTVGDHTIYAHWDAKSVTITVKNLSGGTAEGTISGKVGSGTATTSSTLTLTASVAQTITLTSNPSNNAINKWVKGTTWTDTSLGTTATLTYTITASDGEAGAIDIRACYMLKVKAISVTNYTVGSTGGTVRVDDSLTLGATSENSWSFTGSNSVKMTGQAVSGYAFGGWFTDSACTNKVNAGTNVSGTTQYTYSLSNTNLTYPKDYVYYALFLKQSTLTIDANGGTYSQTSVSGNYGTSITLGTPTRTGYTFSGWALTGGGKLTNNSTYTFSDTNGTVTAGWTANTYTIVFNGNGNTGGSTASITATYDQTYTLTTNGFTKTGYTFAGWATSASGSVAYADKASVKNLTTSGTYNLYAKWTANTYTIVFNANGGSGTMSNLSMTYDTAKDLTANAFTKTGYTFAGWATSATGAVVYADMESVNNLTTSGTCNLYAQWTANGYTTEYYVGDTKLGSSSHTFDTAKALNSWSSLSGTYPHSAYGFNTFYGWTTGTGASINYTDGQSVTNLASASGAVVKLYAVQSRTVTFYSGVSKASSPTQTQYVNTKSLTTSQIATGTPTAITGWTALGWRDDTSADTKEITTGNFTPAYNTANTYYAVYSRTLTFKSGASAGTTDGTSTQHLNTNGNAVSAVTSYTPATVSGWTALGYRADGTATTQDYGIATSVSPVYNISSTLYAVYSRSTTFNSGINNATKNPQTQYLNASGNAVSSVNATCASISNWTIVGWSSSTTGTTAELSSGNISPAYNTTLASAYYGVYSRNYVANFYSGVSKAQTKTITSTTSLYNSNMASLPTTVSITTDTEANCKTISNWTALGWRDNTTADKQSTDFGKVAVVAFGTNFYAVYSRTLTVAFNGNNSTSGSTASVTKTVYLNSNSTTTSSQQVTLTANGFARSGHTFTGWATSSTGAKAYDDKASVTPSVAYNATTFGVTLYAVWSANTYTVTYNGNGGTASTTSKEVVYGSTYGDLATATRTGYTFKGWFTSTTGGTQVTSTTTVTTASAHTIYAQWTVSTTIKYYGTSANIANATNITLGVTAGSLSSNSIALNGTSTYTNTYGSTVAQITLTISRANSSYNYYISVGSACTSSSDLNSTTYAFTPTNTTINIYVAERVGLTINYSAQSIKDATNLTLSTSAGSLSATTLASGGTAILYQVYSGTNPTLTVTRANSSYDYYLNVSSTCTPSSSVNTMTYTYTATSSTSITVYVAQRMKATMNFGGNYTNAANLTYTVTGGATSSTTQSKSVAVYWYAIYDTTAIKATVTTTNTSRNYYIGGSKDGTWVRDGKNTNYMEWTPTADTTISWNMLEYFTATITKGTGISSATFTTVWGNNNRLSNQTTNSMIYYGEKVVFSATASDGYTFKEFNTKADGTGTSYTDNPYTLSSITSDITLYALTTANGYTVTYNPNGGSVSPTSNSVTYAGTYGTLPTPTREGYTFNGWFTALSGGTQVTSSTKVTTAGNHTIYAQWTAKTYSVTSGSNHGSVSVASAGTFDSALSISASASQTGYTFAISDIKVYSGTSTSGTLLTTITATSGSYTMTGTYYSSIYVYATWTKTAKTYAVTSGANYGSVSVASTGTFDSALSISTSASATGYTFTISNIKVYSGTSTSGTLLATITATSGSYTMTGTYYSSVYVYATWTRTANVYTVSLDNQTATTAGTTAIYEKYATGWYSNSGATTSIASITIPTKTGYTFGGYYTATNGGGTQIIKADGTIIGGNTQFSADATIYAQWTAKTSTVTITTSTTFAETLTSDCSTTGSYTIGDELTLKFSVATNFSAYRWIKYYGDTQKDTFSGASTTYTITAEDMENGNLKFEACASYSWNKVAVTNFDTNSNAGNNTGGSVSGYWNADTWYAKLDNGSSATGSVTMYAKPNTGYKFVGWYLRVQPTLANYTSKLLVSAENCTLSSDGTYYSYTFAPNTKNSADNQIGGGVFYALFLSQTTLTINANGGTYTGSTSITDLYGSTATILTPTRTGYTFNGWTLSGGGTYENNVYTFGTANGTLTANWSIDNYTLTLNYNGGTKNWLSQNYTGLDGTFENGTVGLLSQYGTGNTEISSNAFNGNKSLTFRVDTAGEYSYQARVYTYMRQCETATYTLRARVSADADSSLQVVAQRTSDWTQYFAQTITIQAGTWYQFSQTITMGESDEAIFLYFFAKNLGVNYYIDDIEVKRAEYTPDTLFMCNIEDTGLVTLPYAIKDGYTFVGWNTSSTATASTTTGWVTSYKPSEITSDTTYYAVYTLSKATIVASNSASEIIYASGSSILSSSIDTNGKTFTTKYQWYRGTSADFTPSSTTLISGATSASYTHASTTTNIGTYYYKCVVTISEGTESVSTTSNYVAVTVKAGDPKLTISMTDYKYADTLSTPSWSIGHTKSGSENVTFYYSTTNTTSGGTEWKNMTSTTLNVGKYYMYAVIQATGNYASATSSAVAFNVLAGDMSVTISTNNNSATETIKDNGVVVGYKRIYDGKALIGYVSSSVGFTINYGTSTSYGSSATGTANQSIEIGEITAVSDVTYYYSVTAPNYNAVTGSIRLLLQKATADVVWQTGSYTYNGKDQASGVTAYILDVNGNQIACNITFSGKATTFKDAGSYTATASLADTSTYTLTNTTKALTMNKLAVTLTADNKSMTYGDSNAPTYTYTSNITIPDTHTVTYTVKNSSGTAVTVNSTTSAGTYTITPASTLSTSNYTITYKDGTLTIGQYDLSGATITGISNKTYTGSAITQTITVKALGATLTEGTHYTVSYSNNINVGTATVTITAKTNTNYTGSKSATFTITAQSVAVPTLTGTAPVYDGTVKTANIPTNPLYTITGNTGTNAGSYNATVSLNSTNYVWSTGDKTAKTIAWTISKATVTLTMDSATVTLRNGKTAVNAVSISKASDYDTLASTATITTSGATDYVSITSSAISSNKSTLNILAKKSTSSTQTVTVTFSGDTNHNSATTTFTVMIRAITVKIVTANGTVTITNLVSGTTNEVLLDSDITFVATPNANYGMLSYKVANASVVYTTTSTNLGGNFTSPSIQVTEDKLTNNELTITVTFDKLVETTVSIVDESGTIAKSIQFVSKIDDTAVANTYTNGKLTTFESSTTTYTVETGEVEGQNYAIKTTETDGTKIVRNTITLTDDATNKTSIKIQSTKIYSINEWNVMDNNKAVATAKINANNADDIVLVEGKGSYAVEGASVVYNVTRTDDSYEFIGMVVSGVLQEYSKADATEWSYNDDTGVYSWKGQELTQEVSTATPVVLEKWYTPNVTTDRTVTVTMADNTRAELVHTDIGYRYTLTNNIFSTGEMALYAGTWEVVLYSGASVSVRVIRNGVLETYSAGQTFVIDNDTTSVEFVIS